MTRNGLQFLDIERAALVLQGAGKIPTVDSIREYLGTGSKTTIAHHLRSWRAKQTDESGQLPHELQALVSGLWSRLNERADNRIVEVDTAHQQSLQVLSADLSLLQQHYTTLQDQLAASEESRAIECAAKNDLAKQLQALNQEHLKLSERYQAALTQGETSKAENARLHQLAANIQANLEHYQQAVHQRQTEQTLAMEKQYSIYAHEIADLKHQHSQQEARTRLLEQELIQSQQAYGQLEKQTLQLQIDSKTMADKYQELDRERSTLLEREENSHKMLLELKIKSEKYSAEIRDSEQRIAVLTNQNERFSLDLVKAQDKVEELQQEKIFLIQEKSQMEGCLKLMREKEKV